MSVISQALLLSASLVAAGPALANPKVTPPSWQSRPSQEEVLLAYPTLPLRANLGGMAIINCTINRDGAARGCVVRREAPEGMGFGPAALSLSAGFRFNPATQDGDPIAQPDVNIPIRFDAPRPVANPKYIVTPSAARVAEVYPSEARVALDSIAVIGCHVADTGRLTACRTLWESPAGGVFGKAALSLQNDFQLADRTVAGDSAYGGFFKLQLRLVTAPSESADDYQQYLLSVAWSGAPSADDIRRAYPPDRLQAGAPGVVALRCRVGAAGRLASCQVAEASPAGGGFEAAALALAPKFQADQSANLRPGAGRARPGDEIDTLIRFDPAAQGLLDPAAEPVLRDDEVDILTPLPVASSHPSTATPRMAKSVALECVVAPDGAIKDCKSGVGEASDAGMISRATILASSMRLSVWNPYGLSIAGRRFRVVIPLD